MNMDEIQKMGIPDGATLQVLGPAKKKFQDNSNSWPDSIEGKIDLNLGIITRQHDSKEFRNIAEFALDSLQVWNPKRRCCNPLDVCWYQGNKLLNLQYRSSGSVTLESYKILKRKKCLPNPVLKKRFQNEQTFEFDQLCMRAVERIENTLQATGLEYGDIVWAPPSDKNEPFMPVIIFNPRYLNQFKRVKTQATMQDMLISSLDRVDPCVIVYYLGEEEYANVPIKSLQKFLLKSDKDQIELRQGKSVNNIRKRKQVLFRKALNVADRLIAKVKAERILRNGWIPALGIHQLHLKDYEQFQKEFLFDKTRKKQKSEIKKVDIDFETPSGTYNLPLKEHTALRCSVCKSLFDEPNMLLCDNIKGNCKTCTHIYCNPEPISDTYKDEEWYCIDCKSKTGKLKQEIDKSLGADLSTSSSSHIADIRYEKDELEFFILPERFWTKSVQDTLLLKFCHNSGQLGKIVSMRRKNGIPIDFTRKIINSAIGQTAFHKEYRFSRNNTKFGVDQWAGLFSEEELKKMQYEILTATDPMNLIKYKPNTVDVEPMKYRLKLFLGYRYSYGHGCNLAELYNDVDNVTDVLPYSTKLVTDRLKEFGIIDPKNEDGYFDQVVANIYKRSSSSLGVHKDDSDLFEFPVFSLRLFSDSTLSFGCKGVGMQETGKFIPIPLKKGELTSLYHIAAENFNHCIRPCDITDYSVSLIFRRLKKEKIVVPPTASA